MTVYLKSCNINCFGECDCSKCMYFGGMDHGAVRCLAEKEIRRKKSREERKKKAKERTNVKC